MPTKRYPDYTPMLKTPSWASRRLRDYLRAYRKARSWACGPLRSALAATRFAVRGDSGRFRSHHGGRVSRLYRH